MESSFVLAVPLSTPTTLSIVPKDMNQVLKQRIQTALSSSLDWQSYLLKDQKSFQTACSCLFSKTTIF